MSTTHGTFSLSATARAWETGDRLSNLQAGASMSSVSSQNTARACLLPSMVRMDVLVDNV